MKKRVLAVMMGAALAVSLLAATLAQAAEYEMIVGHA